MKSIRSILCIVITLIALTATVKAEDSIQSLSPELRELLSKEMIAIQGGMQTILPAYVSGDYEQIAQIANKIKNSFILKQSITDAQKKELKAKLPGAFIKLDVKFHEYAGMLQHVAVNKKSELVGFYYSKLTEACVACHSEYALHKFPKLDVKAKSDHHHHHH